MVSRRMATLDIGSNSVTALIAEELEEGKAKILAELGEVTALGRGLGERGLDPKARARTLEVLRAFRRAFDRYEVDEVRAVATAAMRDACDGPAFAREIQEEVGFPVDIISGEREGALSFLAVARGFGLAGLLGVLDVGGRSTEIMVGEADGDLERVSHNLGCVSGTERYLHSDPVTDEELDALRDAVRALLASHPIDLKGAPLFGVAATVIAHAVLSQGLERFERRRVRGVVLTRDEIARWVRRMAAMPCRERRTYPGMDPRRADILPAGGVVVHTIMCELDVGSLIVSDYGLRHGVLFDAWPGLRALV